MSEHASAIPAPLRDVYEEKQLEVGLSFSMFHMNGLIIVLTSMLGLCVLWLAIFRGYL